jgi:maltooligosyltrehalose trehalohydrolase
MVTPLMPSLKEPLTRRLDGQHIQQASRFAVWEPSLGAWPEQDGVRFSVWAPEEPRIEVEWTEPGGERRLYTLDRHADGKHGGFVPNLPVGTRYRYRLSGDRHLPDPASRFQPEGVHGPSEVIDAGAFIWNDAHWAGIPRTELILYELHVGTFSDAGTFAGIEKHLDYLAHLGVTAIELMPIAEFAGRWNWGYDGVDLFAPSHNYGRPDDLRRLVDAAHRRGLAVVLDVVYNHLGPDGAYLSAFSPYYFTDRHHTPWGAAVNLDAEYHEPVREFFIQNALHWIHEYHIDGLRLDATHELQDDSGRHFLEELADAVHSAVPRHVVVIAEDDRNLASIGRESTEGGYGVDAIWADDFHHHLRRRIAGDHEGYFRSYTGATADIARTIQSGWFFTGQVAEQTGKPRGTDPSPLGLEQFVFCIQNHDQIGNRPYGDRLLATSGAAAYRAASALLLCAPQTPLLFMGQEWGATTPFLFFTDHDEALGRGVTEGRRAEFSSFSAFRDPATRESIPDPQSPRSFEASRLKWSEMIEDDRQRMLRLYRALLAHRRTSASMRTCDRRTVTAVALDDATVAVWRQAAGSVQTVLVARLSADGGTVRLPGQWTKVLSTEDAGFALDGHPPVMAGDQGGVVLSFSRPSAILLRGAAPT